MNQFKGKQFQKDVIIVTVGYYLRYNLSYQKLQELLYDRGMENILSGSDLRFYNQKLRVSLCFDTILFKKTIKLEEISSRNYTNRFNSLDFLHQH